MLVLYWSEGNSSCLNLKEDGSSKGRHVVSSALIATKPLRNPEKVLEK